MSSLDGGSTLSSSRSTQSNGFAVRNQLILKTTEFLKSRKSGAGDANGNDASLLVDMLSKDSMTKGGDIRNVTGKSAMPSLRKKKNDKVKYVVLSRGRPQSAKP
jgi:hypothetical protein